MKEGKQTCTDSYVADLCEACQNLGNVSIGAKVQFGNLDAIQSRLPCKMCHLVSVAIQNHRGNRPHESHNRRDENFWIVPQHTPPPGGRKHGYACICHSGLRIDSNFHSPPRSIGIIRQTHSRSGCLAAEENSQLASLNMLGGLGRSVECHEDGGSLNIPLIRSWLQTCEGEHDWCNLLPNGAVRSISRLLLIDVESMCLVEAAAPRYFALSYVWGAAKVLMTLKSNFSALTQPGVLERLGEEVPLLIRDVILFMQRLGERYLWVDSLCIIQDDDSTKLDLIRRMDIIYAEAVCTIIAHGSIDASCPLPGVRQHTRRPYRLTTTRRIAGADKGILVCSPCHYTAYPSVYDTRGWTFQEQLLSRRRLVFGADQVFFSCHSQAAGDWCEDPLTDLGNSATNPAVTRILDARGSPVAIQPNFNPDLTGMADKWKTQQAILSISQLVSSCAESQDQKKRIIHMYTSAVTHYSSRRLSFPSDILNAFSGILSTIERSCGFRPRSSVYGLLERHLLYNLHWTAKTAARRQGWPSWSWVGWNSQIYFLEREDPGQLDLQIQEVYVIDRGEIKMIPSSEERAYLPPHSAIDTLATIPPPPNPPSTTSSGHSPDEPDIPSDRLDHLLHTSESLPLLAFWAKVAAPGALRIRFHPTRPAKVRIYQNDYKPCGHVHEEFDWTHGTSRPTDEAWDRCRLVYLSHSPRRCVFHIYEDCECAGTCNALVVDPGEAAAETECVYAARVAMAEVCGNTWRGVATTREFVAFA
ncbi:hypothetical protein DL769_008580 [Monosporascus sp. CRB-8-3]|nr:hypothetical protein DL769_008580 [Monosporascus sp. CRB-8-3]